MMFFVYTALNKSEPIVSWRKEMCKKVIIMRVGMFGAGFVWKVWIVRSGCNCLGGEGIVAKFAGNVPSGDFLRKIICGKSLGG